MIGITGRSPHGERGLKFREHGIELADDKSLPTRGAWIEMNHRQGRELHGTVAPHTGSVD